ncbi:MAG: DNA circularization protein [Prokaryotic dsDNA virus sp.]|nr:MAG: DNA circularization protein [Prokaryotic dsDNA virus sp.]|tara:strand:- start:46019 stop:47419 length:1401 start_codon:yes stop_codon:yes gene_type:complete
MTDNLTRQLLPASFKGIPFLVRSEILPEEGRKIVLHEYVNSSERFVEDLGQLPPKFTVRAFVTGSDFKARSDALRQALNESGAGSLTLPVFGTQNVYALPYSIDASQQSVGEIAFNLEFAAGRPAAGPAQSPVDVEEVYQLGDEARLQTENTLASDWINPDTAANASVAEYDFQQAIADSYEEIKNTLPVETLSKVGRIIQNTQLNASSLIRSGGDLAATFVGASDVNNPGFWQNISLGLSRVASESAATGTFSLNQGLDLLNTFQSPLSSAFGDLISLTNFGAGLALRLSDIRGDYVSDASGASVPLWPATTQGRIERNANRESIVYTTRINALIAAYEVAAANEYRTIDDVNTVRQELENAHEQLMRVDTQDSELIQSDSNVRTAVEDVRLASLAVLDQKRQQTFDTTTINLGAPVSSFVLAYKLNAEEFTDDVALANRGLELRDLNPDDAATMIEGQTTVFRT